jgi:hypothetical protein
MFLTILHQQECHNWYIFVFVQITQKWHMQNWYNFRPLPLFADNFAKNMDTLPFPNNLTIPKSIPPVVLVIIC